LQVLLTAAVQTRITCKYVANFYSIYLFKFILAFKQNKYISISIYYTGNLKKSTTMIMKHHQGNENIGSKGNISF
jgi:hypothetical protein